jgi:hypothetical protein
MAASTVAVIGAGGAFASTVDTTITWTVAAPAIAEGDSGFPDTAPLDLSTVFGAQPVFFSKVLSAEVFDVDDTSGPHGGDDSLDDDDPIWTYVGEDSDFINDFEVYFDDDVQITIGESDDPYDDDDQRDLADGVYMNDDIRFVSRSSGGVDANLGDPGFGIFWAEDSETVLLAYADQNASADSDFNDLWVTVNQSDVNVVPLPAAGWMLLAGLGGMAALRRRQKA